jgi:hypothetical protein
MRYRLVRDVAVFGLVFQVVHFVEHGAQLGYWFLNPTEKPWLTPWAAVGRDLLAIDGTAAAGNELLHLLGNLIFMAGLVGLAVLAGQAGPSQNKYLHQALSLQGLHCLEHLLLTGTYLVWGTPFGVTTLFGAATGTFGSSLRVGAHFLLNLAATYLTGRALLAVDRRSWLIGGTRRSAPSPNLS